MKKLWCWCLCIAAIVIFTGCNDRDHSTVHPDVIDLVIEEIEKASDWANQHHDELVMMLAPILNVDETSVEMMVQRREYGLDDITEEMMQEQQEIADQFFELEIIPKRIQVEEMMKK